MLRLSPNKLLTVYLCAANVDSQKFWKKQVASLLDVSTFPSTAQVTALTSMMDRFVERGVSASIPSAHFPPAQREQGSFNELLELAAKEQKLNKTIGSVIGAYAIRLSANVKSRPKPEKDTTTALALLVEPGDVYNKINDIRSSHDAAYPRWMPHVNFLFPFVKPQLFPQCKQRLDNVLRSFGDFSLHFDKIGHFLKSGKATFHLKVSAASATRLGQLFALVRAELSEVEYSHGDEFVPHLTLAQCSAWEVAATETMLTHWLGPQGITIPVTHLSLIARTGDAPFVVVDRVLLNNPTPDKAGHVQPQPAPVRIAIDAVLLSKMFKTSRALLDALALVKGVTVDQLRADKFASLREGPKVPSRLVLAVVGCSCRLVLIPRAQRDAVQRSDVGTQQHDMAGAHGPLSPQWSGQDASVASALAGPHEQRHCCRTRHQGPRAVEGPASRGPAPGHAGPVVASWRAIPQEGGGLSNF